MPKNRINAIKASILESPGWKTLFSTIIPIIVGILSGVFVAEITIDGFIVWSQAYKAKSAYGLLIVGLASYSYYKAIYLYEKSIEKFLDDDYCRAYMRSKCLPEAAERYKESIRSGNGGELTQAMREFERILK